MVTKMADATKGEGWWETIKDAIKMGGAVFGLVTVFKIVTLGVSWILNI